MNLFIVICISMFLLTFLMLSASGGSAPEGTAAPGAAFAQPAPGTASAQPAPGAAQAAASAQPAAPAQSTASAAPMDNLVTTSHSAVVRGKPLDYTVTAGTMVVDTAGGKCELFFAAYTVEGAANGEGCSTMSAAARPLTFVFNGGPGSSSEWMHMGFLGPRRIAFDQDGQVAQFPALIADNDYSVLDITDLVFIDPVGTGYSRPVEGADLMNFIGYENDNRTVGDFIRLYINRYGRWSSPKYLAGESYGTIRAIGLAKYLSDRYSLGLNGIMLISSVNDFTTMMENSPSDYTYALYLPTYAADAWYHGRLAPQYQDMNLEELLAEVRAFAGGEYLSALFAGRRLDDARREEVAARIAVYTGLDKQDILKANLRVLYWDFCEKLLSDRRLVIGRIDGRYTGPATGGSMADGEADPSAAALSDVFGMAVNQYINDELGFHTDRHYEPISLEVNEKWKYPATETGGFSQEKIIYEVMSKNRFMKIWVLCGYYDMATPFFAAEWTYDHVFLNKEYEKNLMFTYYPSGHMIYMHEPSLAEFREQAEKWYRR